MNIVVAGGTGFIGKTVIQQLIEAGHKVILLTRNPEKMTWMNKNYVRAVKWDPKHSGEWMKSIDGADAVINLAGESIAAKRWSKAQKEKIIKSRTTVTRLLVDAIKAAGKKPSVFISASAVGYYGNVPDGEVTEYVPKGKGFLADTCELWEKEAIAVKDAGIRDVIIRIGVVLGKDGGALTKILPPFQMFIGGPVGSGNQWFPWVHRSDVAGVIVFALTHDELKGPVNVTAPESVTMKQFCSTLGQVLHRPSWFPVPGFALKILLGEMSEMLLTGQKAVPKKLINAGYAFRYPKLEEALKTILN